MIINSDSSRRHCKIGETDNNRQSEGEKKQKNKD